VSEQIIQQRQITVGTAATPIGEGRVTGSTFHLYAEAGGNATIYVGGSDVTTSNGYILHKGLPIVIAVPERIQLYAVATNAGEKISVLQIGGI
jgi:hypothetical protein